MLEYNVFQAACRAACPGARRFSDREVRASARRVYTAQILVGDKVMKLVCAIGKDARVCLSTEPPLVGHAFSTDDFAKRFEVYVALIKRQISNANVKITPAAIETGVGGPPGATVA